MSEAGPEDEYPGEDEIGVVSPLSITEVGRNAGRATALTVVLPLKLGGVYPLRLWLYLLRVVPFRGWAVGTLDRQRFVQAIRWSILPPFTDKRSPPWERPADGRWQLLFESNFDGDWDEYLDVFGAVMGGPLKSLIYWARGFPGLDNIDLFKAYAKAFDHAPEHYASAYPDLTSADIYQRAIAQASDPAAARTRVSKGGYGRNRPTWTTVLLPLKEGRDAEAARISRTFSEPGLPDSCPFVGTGLVHFVRVVVLRRPSGSWLLITATHDGPAASLFEQVVARDSSVDPLAGEPGRIRRLIECTAEVPDDLDGWWSDGDVVRHLLAAVPDSSGSWMAYCGYPGWTVAEIRALANDVDGSRWPEPERP
jgi:hypothetical protein